MPIMENVDGRKTRHADKITKKEVLTMVDFLQAYKDADTMRRRFNNRRKTNTRDKYGHTYNKYGDYWQVDGCGKFATRYDAEHYATKI